MEAPQLERKLVAILAADVAGYSRLMGGDEEGTLATLSAFRNITDALISRFGGHICGTAGDSVLSEFASVFSAVQCAVQIQQQLAEANKEIDEDRRMWFRMGVNVGDVMVKDGDIFGDGVNIAARIEALAEPGGICISRGVHDHIMRKLAYRFEDLGEKNVKNIAQPIRVFRLLFDPAETMAGEAALTAEPSQAYAAEVSDISAAIEPAPAESQTVELAFWDSIKSSVHETDFEAYLTQYPQGSFVSLARLRLAEFAAPGSHDPQDREVELLFWESVRNSDNPSSLQAYLAKYPDGEFKALAEIRLVELGAELP